MSSASWMKALERFDRDVDINAMTRKEVCLIYNHFIYILHIDKNKVIIDLFVVEINMLYSYSNSNLKSQLNFL